MLGSLWSRLKGFAPSLLHRDGALIVAYHRALWLAGAVDHLGDALLRCAEYATQRSRSTTEHLLLFVLQLAIGGTLYFILSAWDHVIATSLFMCFPAPAAAAAGAMTSLMDG